MTKNLKDRAYPERFAMKMLIHILYKDAEDAYQLSMPLLASALQGDENLYNNILPKMKQLLKAIPTDGSKTSYKAWLLGRVLLAADTIGDNTTRVRMEKELKALLFDEKTPKDSFSAWAWGYLANLNDEYEQSKKYLLDAALDLSSKYQHIKQDQKQEAKQDALSSALWAWIMALQAAANAQDKSTYTDILNQIKAITMQQSVSEALSKGLLRTAASNDYPAWALSITRLAAATIGDQMLYEELEKPLTQSIKSAKHIKPTAEEMLAQVNAALATTRWNQHQAGKIYSFSNCTIM